METETLFPEVEAGTERGLLWLGKGTVLRCGDVAVADPMTYCGAGFTDENEASCVYTGMPVDIDRDIDPTDDLGYWPSYSSMKPRQRGYYLRWLASGKETPPADIGYAFVYFYGLERRALLDQRDVFWIIEEAKRLFELGDSRSFRGYLGRFLVYLHAKHLNDLEMTEKSLADLYRLLPASRGSVLSRLVLGYRALQNAPLSAEQAFNLLRRLPKTGKSRIVSPRFSSSPELQRLFAVGYERIYPQGFTLSASFGGKNSAEYSVASGTLSFSNGAKSPPPVAVPNVLGKASQFKKLQTLYDACIEELAASKGRNVSDELVVARPGGGKIPGEPLPLVRIDMNKVAALKEETEALTRDLAAIFDLGEADSREADSREAAEPELHRTKTVPEDFLLESLPFPKEIVEELDRRYWPCVPSLLRQAVWDKESLSSLARRHALMPNAMLEAVNTWSDETLGDFLLLEEGDVWILNLDLQLDLQSRSSIGTHRDAR